VAMGGGQLTDEFGVISRYFRPLTGGKPAALDLGDDGAVIQSTSGAEIVITCDALIAGVHFLEDSQPQAVAARALRVNLSDLAAMGAAPVAYTLALMVPVGTPEKWFEEFSLQLLEDQKRYGIWLIGGDTVATPGPLSVSITAFGEVPCNSALTRSTAGVGDRIYVTGTIGDAALGLSVLKGDLKQCDKATIEYFVKRFLWPEPRLSVGRGMRGIASAAVDISDGLLADIGHICVASDVGAKVWESSIPFSSRAGSLISTGAVLRSQLMGGGDDYELVLVVPEKNNQVFWQTTVEHAVAVTEIGVITGGNEVCLVDEQGNSIGTGRLGYRHAF